MTLKAKFSESLETTAKILGRDFGVQVKTQGNRFRYVPKLNLILLPDIREEIEVGDSNTEWERNAFLGGELHEIAHKLFTDIKFMSNITRRLRMNAKNPKVANRLLSYLTMYCAFEDIRIEKLVCEQFDGAHALLTILQQYCERDEEGIVDRQIKKLDGFIQRNEKLNFHDIRLLAWFVAIELYGRINYGSGIKELKYKRNIDKYMAVRLINKIVKKIINNEKFIKLVEDTTNMRAPLEAGKIANKIFHSQLGKFFNKEAPPPPEKSKSKVEESEESDEEQKPNEENESDNGKEEESEESGEEKAPKYETSEEEENELEQKLSGMVEESIQDRDSDLIEPLEDDKYNDKIFSMFINAEEVTPEQLDPRNMLMNSKIFIRYFGKNMKFKIPFPPMQQHDSIINVSDPKYISMLYNYGKIRRPEEKDEFYKNLDKLDRMIYDIRWQVYVKLLAKKKMLPRIDRTEGDIDNEALATYSIDPRIFYDLRWRKRFDTAVEMMCDLSTSMTGHKLMMMCEVMYTLSQIMQAFGIPFEVFGFNAGVDFTTADGIPEAGTLTKEMTMLIAKEGLYGDIKKYYRFCPVNHYILKEFRDNYETLRANIYNFYVSDFGSNVDNEALVFGVKRLLAMPNKRKIMLIISDGMPNPQFPSGFDDGTINKAAEELQQKMGRNPERTRKAISQGYKSEWWNSHTKKFHHRKWLPRNANMKRVNNTAYSIAEDNKKFVLDDFIKGMYEASKHVEIGYISIHSQEVARILEEKNREEKNPNLQLVNITHRDNIAEKILLLLEKLLLKGEL